MGWGCLYELESLEMEQRYECWSVKGTTAESPLPPSHTNTIWVPLAKKRRLHTCTTQRKTRKDFSLESNTLTFRLSSDTATFLKIHLLLTYAEFYLLCFFNKTYFFKCINPFTLCIDGLFETFILSNKYVAGRVPNPLHDIRFLWPFFPHLSFYPFPLSPPLCLAILCRAAERENRVKDDFKKIS